MAVDCFDKTVFQTGFRAKTIWAQLGIANPIAAQLAADHRIDCIMDAFIKIEYLRLGLSPLTL